MNDYTKVKNGLQLSDELTEYYTVIKNEFEDHIKREIAKEPPEIAPLIEKGLNGGKKLRPVLCRLVSDALGGDTHLAFECGMALELMHSGALIHDDWIDGDKFRRAAPSLWNELGPRTAVLAADLMVATGSLHGAISVEIGKSLASCVRDLSEGAIADFTKAIELGLASTNLRNAHYNRGMAKEFSEDYNGAIADFDKAIEIDPKYEIAYKNRGIVKLNIGDLSGACDDWIGAAILGDSAAAQLVADQCN